MRALKDEMKSGDANSNFHDNDYCVVVRICSKDMKTFNSKTKCPNCKHEFVSYEEIIICSSCETLSLITDCHSPILIKCNSEIAEEKVPFITKQEMIECFIIPTNKKLALGKSILNSKVNIVYNSWEENVVINMTLSDFERCIFKYNLNFSKEQTQTLILFMLFVHLL